MRHKRLTAVALAATAGAAVVGSAVATLEEIAPLTGPDNRSADAGRHIRALAGDDRCCTISASVTLGWCPRPVHG